MVATVIGALRAELSLNSAQFDAGAVRAQGTLRRLGGGFSGLQASAQRVDMRGVAQQFSQVAQSAMATGNPIQALAIQLPDIAGMLGGPVAIAAGVAAGALLPLAANFLASGDAGDDAKSAIERFRESAGSIKATLDVANASLDELHGFPVARRHFDRLQMRVHLHIDTCS